MCIYNFDGQIKWSPSVSIRHWSSSKWMLGVWARGKQSVVPATSLPSPQHRCSSLIQITACHSLISVRMLMGPPPDQPWLKDILTTNALLWIILHSSHLLLNISPISLQMRVQLYYQWKHAILFVQEISISDVDVQAHISVYSLLVRTPENSVTIKYEFSEKSE